MEELFVGAKWKLEGITTPIQQRLKFSTTPIIDDAVELILSLACKYKLQVFDYGRLTYSLPSNCAVRGTAQYVL